jgi:hypothetical protein
LIVGLIVGRGAGADRSTPDDTGTDEIGGVIEFSGFGVGLGAGAELIEPGGNGVGFTDGFGVDLGDLELIDPDGSGVGTIRVVAVTAETGARVGLIIGFVVDFTDAPFESAAAS